MATNAVREYHPQEFVDFIRKDKRKCNANFPSFIPLIFHFRTTRGSWDNNATCASQCCRKRRFARSPELRGNVPLAKCENWWQKVSDSREGHIEVSVRKKISKKLAQNHFHVILILRNFRMRKSPREDQRENFENLLKKKIYFSKNCSKSCKNDFLTF